jgi:hypothetical protein
MRLSEVVMLTENRAAGFMRSVSLVVITVFACLAVGAQDTTALSGTVTDPDGKVVVGATVTVTSSATNTKRIAKTGENGSYSIAQLVPGTYQVRVEAQGFKSVVHENVQLQVQTPVRLNVRIEVGAVNETISISGGDTNINTQDATVGNSFTSRQITQLPLEGRDVTALLSLQPGVVFVGDRTADTRNRNGSVNGGRSDQANITLDGVDVNDQQDGTAFSGALRVTTDSVQEFRVTTINPNADQGRSSGAQVILVTRTGGNTFNGSLFESHRNTVTTANNFFNNAAGRYGPNDSAVLSGLARVGDPRVPRPKLLRNVFGGAFGGPIKKDKLFFFLNYEGRRDASETTITRTVPSADLRNGIIRYRNRAGQIISLSPTQVAALDPRHIGPNSGILQLYKQYPLPNDTTVGDGINVSGFRFSSPISVDLNAYLGRADYSLSDKHSIFWRGNLQDDESTTPQQFPGKPPAVTMLNTSKGFAVGDNMALRPNLTNAFRYGYTRQELENISPATGPNIILNVSDILGSSRSNGRTTPVHNFVDDLSWLKGSHSFGAGTNIRFIRNETLTFARSFSTAAAAVGWVPTSVARALQPSDLDPLVSAQFRNTIFSLLGVLTSGTASYNFDRDGNLLSQGAPVERRFAADEYEFYAQDSWRLKPNLTVNFGLRYGLYSPPWETNGNQVTSNVRLSDWFDLRGGNAAKGIPQSASPVLSNDLAGPVNGKRGFYDWDKNNFAPRFSFAYSPGFKNGLIARITGGPGKMSIRGGASVVFDRIGSALAVAHDSFGSFGLSTSVQSTFGALTPSNAPRFVSRDVIPSGVLPKPPSISFPATFPRDGEEGSFAISSSLDDKIRTPYSIGFNFSIQREFPKNFTLELAYVGRESKKLLTLTDMALPVNLVDPTSKMSYFQAAQQVIAADGTPISKVSKVPFWENLFPHLAVTAQDLDDIYGTFFLSNPQISPQTSLSSTQVAYFLYNQVYGPSYVEALFDLDVLCSVSCSKFGPYSFFNDQFATLYAWRSFAPAHYHSFQAILRKRFSNGVQFDFNYTLSKSIDWASAPERSFSGTVINSWFPGQSQAVSDFDVRHQVNANWIAELPFGRGKLLGKNVGSITNAFIGGWQLSGIYRWTSGFPISVTNLLWPTNWDDPGFASLIGKSPDTKTTKNAATLTGQSGPNIFTNPEQAFEAFKPTTAGDTGVRNNLRGDGFFGIDLGLGKSWRMPWSEGHRLQFRWETFNVTNSVRFDVGSLSLSNGNAGTFGKYSRTLTNPRVMQFLLRYEF